MATTTRAYKGKTYVTHLLRRSIRKGKTVTHETLGNLSHLPDHLIEIIKRSLKGEPFVPAAEAFRITRSLRHEATASGGATRRASSDRAGLRGSAPGRGPEAMRPGGRRRWLPARVGWGPRRGTEPVTRRGAGVC